MRWLGLGILIGGMVLAHNAYKQGNGGFHGLFRRPGIGALDERGFRDVLSTAFSFVYMKFVDPEYMSRMAWKPPATKMEEKGGMTDEQIDQAMAMMQKFSTAAAGWCLFGVLGSLLFGFLNCAGGFGIYQKFQARV